MSEIASKRRCLVDERLILTKSRVAAAPWCQTLMELACHVTLKNIQYFMEPKECSSSLTDLPNNMRQKILDHLEMNCKREESLNYDKHPTDEVRFKKNLALIEVLLGPETREFELDWLMISCPPDSKALNSENVLQMLTKLAPNLRSLTIGRKYLLRDVRSHESDPLLSVNLKKFIMEMPKMTRLTLNKIEFTCSELVEFIGKLPNLNELSCVMNNIDVEINFSALMDCLKQLKIFTFHLKSRRITSLADIQPHEMENFGLVRHSLATRILLNSPQLEVVGNYASDMVFTYKLNETDELLTTSRLQHLSINLESPLTEAQWRMLPDITHLKVRRNYAIQTNPFDVDVGFQLLLKFPKLRALHLYDDIGQIYLAQILQTYGQNLHTLSLSVTKDGMTVRLRELFNLCPNLRELRFLGKATADPVQYNPQDCFKNLKVLYLTVFATPDQIEISKLLSAPNLEKVTLDDVTIDVADAQHFSAQVKNGEVFKNLSSFRFHLSSNVRMHPVTQEAYDTVSDLVKNICAYAPKVAEVKFNYEQLRAYQPEIKVDDTLADFLSAQRG